MPRDAEAEIRDQKSELEDRKLGDQKSVDAEAEGHRLAVKARGQR